MFGYRILPLVAISLGLQASVGQAGERTDYPRDARDRYERAQELLKKGQFREAMEAFEKAIGLGMQDFPRARLGSARSALGLKDYDAGIARYSKFIERFGLEESCRH